MSCNHKQPPHPPLEEVIGTLLTQLGLTLALAESCTGGLIGHRLTNVAGSSRYFIGSVVAYAYEAKEIILGVDHDTIAREGAVSADVVLAMARGVRRLLSTDIALAVTGIAGPGGATPTKPVGLTYIALTTAETEVVRRYVWNGDRESNKAASAEAALTLLYEHLRHRSPRA